MLRMSEFPDLLPHTDHNTIHKAPDGRGAWSGRHSPPATPGGLTSPGI